MDTRVGRARGRIGRSRRESTGVELRARPTPSRIDRSRQESTGVEFAGVGRSTRRQRLRGGTESTLGWLGAQLDSCRFLSTPVDSARVSPHPSNPIPVDSRRLGTAARRLLGRPRKNSTSRKIVCQVSVKPASKKRQKKRRPQEAASLCDKMTILTSESASARYCGSPRRSGHPGDRADPSRIRRW